VISSGATCPSRSLVACTLELKPLVILLPVWAKLIADRLDDSLDQLSIVKISERILFVSVNEEIVKGVNKSGYERGTCELDTLNCTATHLGIGSSRM
jgi:hypothetical protein